MLAFYIPVRYQKSFFNSLPQIALDFNEITVCSFDSFLPKWLIMKRKLLAFLPGEPSIENCGKKLRVVFNYLNTFRFLDRTADSQRLFLCIPKILPAPSFSAKRSKRGRSGLATDTMDSATDLFLQIFPVISHASSPLLFGLMYNLSNVYIGKHCPWSCSFRGGKQENGRRNTSNREKFLFKIRN